ncbi:MAG: diacylglycerol kinase [Treponema sp.]|jgi:diacylglycerol kinase family enzyme|nr:diacylglycerol kinase [Treponema sp.]
MKADLETFYCRMAAICSHCMVVTDSPVRWTIIANPNAGGFTIPSRWKIHAADLYQAEFPQKMVAETEAYSPFRRNSPYKGLFLTEGTGDAKEFTKKLIDGMGNDDAFHLIITAGGDGTSLEVLSALFLAVEKDKHLKERCAVLRLPMGTGNDGADAWKLSGALDLLLKPARVELVRGLRLWTSTPGKDNFLAFNILSVGLDAFVTHNTNKMKGKLPGDFYKLWLDIAALFYDRIYHVGPMSVKTFDENLRQTGEFQETLLLLAMGASGHRTYGSHNRILPDDRNVCAVRQMPLFRKIALKKQVREGTHTGKPETILTNAFRVEFQGSHPILAQMDGETVLLNKEDYPCVITLSEPVIPVLQAIETTNGHRACDLILPP